MERFTRPEPSALIPYISALPLRSETKAISAAGAVDAAGGVAATSGLSAAGTGNGLVAEASSPAAQAEVRRVTRAKAMSQRSLEMITPPPCSGRGRARTVGSVGGSGIVCGGGRNGSESTGMQSAVFDRPQGRRVPIPNLRIRPCRFWAPATVAVKCADRRWVPLHCRRLCKHGCRSPASLGTPRGLRRLCCRQTHGTSKLQSARRVP